MTADRDPAYFGYYGQLAHQQNMMADYARTSAYYTAIKSNAGAFSDKIVLDVGAGSGILSFFAVLAGASDVYAVEASTMAGKMKRLISQGKQGPLKQKLQSRVHVIQAKVEEEKLPVPQVDAIVSEPIGVFLLHERMLESFIVARDRFLKPGGTIFPSNGAILVAPCSDAIAWNEIIVKARFWEQSEFFDVDLSGLALDAMKEYFSMPLVGPVDPKTMLAQPGVAHRVDFETSSLDDLMDIIMPFEWTITYTGLIHGILGWFDVSFYSGDRKGISITLTTSPFCPATHWQQIRFMFAEPLAVNAGETVKGWLRCRANQFRSYSIVGEIVQHGEPSDPEDCTDILEQLADAGKPPLDHEWFLDRRGGGKGIPSAFGRRRGWWQLHEQSYYYTPSATTQVYPTIQSQQMNNSRVMTDVEVMEMGGNKIMLAK